MKRPSRATPAVSAVRRLSSLWNVDPRAAAKEVTAALSRAGNLRDAARALGVGTMTLCRWVKARPELAAFRRAP